MAWAKHIGVGVVCALAAPWASATSLYLQSNANPVNGGVFSSSNSPAFYTNRDRQEVAENFVISGHGPVASVNTVRWSGLSWQGAYPGANINTTVASFTIRFLELFADGSETELLSETFSTGSTSATLVNAATGVYSHEVTLSNAFNADEGTQYWLSIVAEMSDTSKNWAWAVGAAGGDNFNAFRVQGHTGTLLDDVWYGDSGINVTFELLNVGTTVIPLPSVAGLSALGLLAVGGTRRRKIA